MTNDTAADAPERDDEAEVDLDLDAEDVLLREAIGQPTTVRVAGKVISVPHQKDWEWQASQFLGQGLFSAWARLVLSEEDFKAFQDAELRNYQVEKIVEVVTANSGLSLGKRSARSRSSGSTRKR